VKFEISRRARRQIDKIHAWWTGNRPANRSLFLDELDSAERLLRDNPEAGKFYATTRNGVVRRVLLVQTQNHVYYQYRADETSSSCSWSGAFLEPVAPGSSYLA
jgi:plasmid stabilization system protein ParE